MTDSTQNLFYHWACPDCGKKQMVSWDRFECCFGQGYIVSCETPECESTFMVVPKPRIEADLLRFEKAE